MVQTQVAADAEVAAPNRRMLAAGIIRRGRMASAEERTPGRVTIVSRDMKEAA